MILQIALTIMGIFILVKGKASLTRNKVCTGIPAIVVGVLFVLIIPILLVAGFFLGIGMALAGGTQEDALRYAKILDAAVTWGIALTAIAIIFVYSKPRETKPHPEPDTP